MKGIVKQYGWPGPELVRRDGSEASFWCNTRDYVLQKEVLPLVRKAYLAGALKGEDFALLQDRVGLIRSDGPFGYAIQK